MLEFRLWPSECIDPAVSRKWIVATVLLSSALSAAEKQPTLPRAARHLVGPRALARTAAGALITHATNTPSEWGQGTAGFGKRFASGLGKSLVKTGIQFPVAYFRHEAIGYRRSNLEGAGPRLRYALLSTVYTHRTTTGERTVAAGEIAGALGSGLISRLWQPPSTATLASGFASAGIAIAADAGFNVLREFWPDIRHRRR